MSDDQAMEAALRTEHRFEGNMAKTILQKRNIPEKKMRLYSYKNKIADTFFSHEARHVVVALGVLAVAAAATKYSPGPRV
ncbi:MAG: hypothetical protein VX737_03995 [Pseudomonadota bacterium]|nr:hypothetical protein [Pseudomonadota bacterium]